MIDFSATADAVAPQLLGCTLTHAGVTVRITEVEAYLGAEDAAAHTYRGITARNRAMFGPGGRMYVYLSYGIHRAGNIVCAPEGVGQGCLLRAGEVIDGEEIAWQRRGDVPFHRLAQGPGNLGSALGLDLADNGAPVTGPDFVLHPRAAEPEWVRGPRIGITKNAEAPLRFWIPGNKTVSGRRGRR
ncbi:DNA-3-methyladenine glycosylase [Corynebacterium mastitidis]|uniref:Putative 3-methyladenine DNA glycosylase n=1 Tax=Corynebacterium mastitidis TaxID=161890 RepID=A0A2N0X8K6_9CORY|nr:DNA-3-methyladenine glycosylase [Corynebacterium mastitidis]MCH6197043.1 DNA-3-methyladenine glycosylase [Corynebacterium mastitidis]PKF69033.1 DNA-3-methyladenine glycosylase [Corynebacterium mastitidis]